MKPARFRYVRATSVAHALRTLRDEPDAKLLSGGQSLLPLMNLRLARPAVLVDIGHLVELGRVLPASSSVLIGATTTHRAVEGSTALRSASPLLPFAAGHIGHVAIRNQGTLGGSLAHADPAAELPASLLALGATVYAESTDRGRREIPVEAFFVSFFTSALADDEMVTWVRVPTLRAGQGWGFAEIARRHGDFALAGAAAVVDVAADGVVRGMRAALMNVSDVPLLVGSVDGLVGAAADEALWHEVAASCTAGLEPVDQPEHVRRLARAALRTALRDAHRRATTSSGSVV